MAIALFFRRIIGPDTADQATRATYEFGPEPGSTPHQVVVDLAAGIVGSTERGGHDPLASRVAWKVLRQRRETGAWPATGDYFS